MTYLEWREFLLPFLAVPMFVMVIGTAIWMFTTGRVK